MTGSLDRNEGGFNTGQLSTPEGPCPSFDKRRGSWSYGTKRSTASLPGQSEEHVRIDPWSVAKSGNWGGMQLSNVQRGLHLPALGVLDAVAAFLNTTVVGLPPGLVCTGC
jgi:hypothetical protein